MLRERLLCYEEGGLGSSWVTFTAPVLGRLLPIHCFIFQEAISKAVSSIALCTSSLHNDTFYLSFFRASIGQNCARVVVLLNVCS